MNILRCTIKITGMLVLLSTAAAAVEPRYGGNVQRHIDLGKYVAGYDDYERAAQHYEKAWNEEPGSKPIMFTLGALYQKSGNLEQAEIVYKKLLQSYPLDGNAYLCLGNVYLAQRRIDLAVTAFQQATDLNRKDARAFRNRGFAEVLGGAYNSAVQSLQRAIQLEPGNSLAYFDLGLAFYHVGNLNKAQEMFHKGLQIDPSAEGKMTYTEVITDCAGERFARAYQAYCSNNMERAATLFSGLARDFPDYARAYAYLGHAWHHRKPPEYRKAEAAYRAALAARKYTLLSEQELVLVLDNLGMVRMNLGDYLEAEDLFRRGVMAEPATYPVVYYNYGCMLARRGEHAAASIALADAIRRDARFETYLEHHPGLKFFRQTGYYTNLIQTIKKELNNDRTNN